MYLIVLLIMLSLAGSGPADASEQGDREPARNASPMFKGVELYSWKDSKSAEWCFSLLPGTNRMKTYREVTDPLFTKKGVDALKKALTTLATGEQVFWFNTIDKMQPVGNPHLTFPPEPMMKELSDYCASLKVHLNYPAPGSK
ncbi:MAG: hypothetical protein AB2L14_37825 [Candidatus Xenobiia bacterium LiM19]